MRGRACEYEGAVRSLARTGSADAAVRDHLTRCETCRQTLAVAGFMLQLADAAAAPPRLPDPGMLWWKAQLLQRWDAQRQAAAPLETGQHVQVGVGVAGCAGLLVWLWPHLQRWGVELVTPSNVPALSSSVPHTLVTLLAVGGVLLAATAVIAVKGLFTD